LNPNSVVINQILTNTTGASGQAIELYNTTNFAIDIAAGISAIWNTTTTI